MNLDCKQRMGMWWLLTLAGLVFVFLIGSILFFDPGHGIGLLENGKQAPPAAHSGDAPHQ